jgi:hypothetical protein
MSDLAIMAVKIDAIYPHINADKLEIVKIGAYQTCETKGKYQVGDIVAHFPPDILIPPKVAIQLGVESYLKDAIYPGDSEKSKCRVGAIRLRGAASFGFTIKVDVEAGTDLTDRFHGIKYEPPEPEWFRVGNHAKNDPRFHIYTDIQNYRNSKYRNAIPLGTPVRLTEKVHGCVTSQTRVRMSDGSSKYIRNIQPGEFVVGYKDGQPVSSKVIKVWKNGTIDTWLKIQYQRNQAGRGSSFGSITCTPNHEFLQKDGSYKEACKLRLGDLVNLLRSDWYLSPIQEQILLGKLLGDGCLIASSANHHIEFGHANKLLVDWTCQGLGNLIAKKTGTRISGYGSLIYTARTHTSPFISEKFQDFIQDGRKIVPKWVADSLTPLAIAFWYMDDGSLRHNKDQEDRADFAVCGFTKEDCDILIAGLKKYCIDAICFESDGYLRLRLNSDAAERLFLLIAPYIPQALQYKLPERYRRHEGWLPSPGESYKQAFIWQPITSITVINNSQQRWDLETETHNYLPSSVVTHNSNSRVGLIDNEFMCGSHRCTMQATDKLGHPSIYWNPLTSNMKDMLRCISDGGKNVIAFGEIYGSKVQFMDYGRFGADGYVLFDISVDGIYLNWDQIVYYTTRFCVPTVPLLYSGPFDYEVVEQLVDGDTILGDKVHMRSSFKGREGVVITPLTETFSPVLGGRLILKAVSCDYLECRKSDSH